MKLKLAKKDKRIQELELENDQLRSLVARVPHNSPQKSLMCTKKEAKFVDAIETPEKKGAKVKMEVVEK